MFGRRIDELVANVLSSRPKQQHRRQRQPDISALHSRSRELRRRNADDRERDVVQSHRSADDRWIGADGEFVGMRGFGASAPAPVLYREFGITPQNIAEAARRAIARKSQ